MSDARLQRLERRIDELESRHALRDLVSEYCHGFDKRDFARFLAIWWEDCVWDIGPPFGTFTGHDGIRQAVEGVLWPFWRETHHLTTNLKLDFTDPDHAGGVCDVDCVGADADDNLQIVGATYFDDFERRGSTWRIRRRRVQIHYFNPIPGARLRAPETA
ncbi:MAG TPA: nuclear transport factor 2 family protein [Pseudomonadales bacterium]